MLRSVFVKDHMTKNPVTLFPDMEILEAAHRLIDNDISGAPVLDKHGRLVGVLTERDCMRVAMQAGYHGEPGGLVKDFMSQNPQWIGPEQSISDAGRPVHQRPLSPLPGGGQRPPGRCDQPSGRDAGAGEILSESRRLTHVGMGSPGAHSISCSGWSTSRFCSSLPGCQIVGTWPR